MHGDGFDILTLSLARAGGLPLHIDRLSEYEREQRRRTLGGTPSEAAVRETERRMRRGRPLTRATGRLLAGIGRRLSSYGARLAGPALPQVHGCG